MIFWQPDQGHHRKESCALSLHATLGALWDRMTEGHCNGREQSQSTPLAVQTARRATKNASKEKIGAKWGFSYANLSLL